MVTVTAPSLFSTVAACCCIPSCLAARLAPVLATLWRRGAALSVRAFRILLLPFSTNFRAALCYTAAAACVDTVLYIQAVLRKVKKNILAVVGRCR